MIETLSNLAVEAGQCVSDIPETSYTAVCTLKVDESGLEGFQLMLPGFQNSRCGGRMVGATVSLPATVPTQFSCTRLTKTV